MVVTMLFKNNDFLIFRDLCNNNLFFNKSEIPDAQYRPDNQKHLRFLLYDKGSHTSRKSNISYSTETTQANIVKNKTEKFPN